MHGPVYTAPPDSGTAVLGKTLPSLLYDACRQFSNPRAFNQPVGDEWRAWSCNAFREQAEETAAGLLALGLQRGDRVALLMESDAYFGLADMGCLIAGLVDVPIYLTHAPHSVQYVIHHAGATCIVLSRANQLPLISGMLPELSDVRSIVVAETGGDDLPASVAGVKVLSLDDLRESGRRRLLEEPALISSLLERIDPQDLATIIYTSGTTGEPKGVMLTHENISFNALTAFSGMAGYVKGPDGEVTVSFLPLSHIFARTLYYGFMAYGTSIYFSTPENLSRDLQRVRPTVFASVPRVLEKVYSRIREKAALLSGVKKKLLNWALGLGYRYDITSKPAGAYRIQLALADKLVFGKWREALGGRVKYIISGGAALSPELTNLFGAAGIHVLQGYGLTETSPVVSYNRPTANRPGTVGQMLPMVEVAIAEDGEILTRGPHIMKGYYRDAERTAEAIDAEGWFHTGDVGEVTPDGYLRITDRKKDLFKLSTGKYVMPQPLENRLTQEPLVEQAVVVGSGYKFCTALIFPDQEVLKTFARTRGLDPEQPIEQLLKHPAVVARYQELVDAANEGMDHWSTIKRFALIPQHLTIENGTLTPKMSVKRSKVRELFAKDIQTLYDMAEQEHGAHEERERVTA